MIKIHLIHLKLELYQILTHCKLIVVTKFIQYAILNLYFHTEKNTTFLRLVFGSVKQGEFFPSSFAFLGCVPLFHFHSISKHINHFPHNVTAYL